jgi:hypothetical protein
MDLFSVRRAAKLAYQTRYDAGPQMQKCRLEFRIAHGVRPSAESSPLSGSNV